MSEYKFINFTVDNGVGHLELNRPEKKNAINDSLCLEIEHAFINLPDDVSVIVFSWQWSRVLFGTGSCGT
jgi:Enoyl-CoA hydratase/carnithine racemase